MWCLALMLGLSLMGCLPKRVRQADGLVEHGRYTEALEIYRKSLASEPRNRQIQARIATAKKLEGERLQGMADIRLDASDSVRAFELYADATRYDPENAKAREGLIKARDQWLERAKALEQEIKFGEATAIHERILREFRGYQPSIDALARMNDSVASKNLTAASVYFEHDMPGNALVELLKARQIKPGDAGIDQEITRALDGLRLATHSAANVFAKGKSRLVGPPWATFLNERFQEVRIPIAVTPGRGDAALQIELNGVFSAVSRSTGTVQVSMQVPHGMNNRSNPAWDALKQKVDEAQAQVKLQEPPLYEAQARLEEMERDLARRSGTAGAEEEAQRKKVAELSRPFKLANDQYQRLAAQLARLPESFQDPVVVTVTFPADQATASVQLTGEIVITLKEGDELKRIPLHETITATDQGHPKLKALGDRPEIPVDPLELPQDKELMARAESKAMGMLGDAMDGIYHTMVMSRLSEARRLAVNGKVDEAVEGFLVAWLSDPKQSPDEAVRYILDAKRALGLPLLETLQAPPPAHQAAARE